MKEATLIYPHQLFKVHPAITTNRTIYLIEEPLFLTEFPVHRQKLLLHRLSMRAYYNLLLAEGHDVVYISIQDVRDSEEIFRKIKEDGFTVVHIVDPTDYWLSKRVNDACKKFSLILHIHESPLFILSKDDAVNRYRSSKKYLTKFYQTLRVDKKILVTDTQKPIGGKWSFDEDNRNKLPKNIETPTDPIYINNSDVSSAKEWLKTVGGEHYGEALQWLPHTHTDAVKWFARFLKERFVSFGTYEDAISKAHTLLFHSALSPLMNIGLLTPQYVLDETLQYAEKNTVPINSLEGFIRQILGWREFIRASYECDGVTMRTGNFWQHTRSLPKSFWTGTTGLLPVDTAITNALKYGYNHHIERLMVLGNTMLLSQINPDEVYRWFMAMYVDAYDWVMVPNVYGMSQFADGGIFATKPYISGSNYIKKMSDYPSGEWEDIWTALYWNFIETNQVFFMKNHRLSMMPRLLAKMDLEKKEYYKNITKKYLKEI